MKLFVSNLDFNVSEDDLCELFSMHGTPTAVKIVTDRNTKRSKGFGFVEYEDDVVAVKSLYDLNGAELKGRAIVVKEAV